MPDEPQSTTEPTNAHGELLFPETLLMVACDQCDKAQPWPLRCGHTRIGVHNREYTRLSPASTAPVVDEGMVSKLVDAVYRSMAQYDDQTWWLDELKAKARVRALLKVAPIAPIRSGTVEQLDGSVATFWPPAATAAPQMDLEKCMAEPKSDTEPICINCGREVVMSEHGPPINDICWSHTHNGVVWCNWRPLWNSRTRNKEK